MLLTKILRRHLFFFSASALVLMVASQTSLAESVELKIHHRNVDAALVPASLEYRTGTGEKFSVTRLSYLLSGFALSRQDGTWLELRDQAAWMDSVKARDQASLTQIAEGSYTALRFFIGPDPAMNAADVSQWAPDHPMNPNVNGLHWSWQGGFIFLALEGHYQIGNGEVQGYAWHLARDPSRTEIVVPIALTVKGKTTSIDLDFDLATLFAGSSGLSFSVDGATTHSRPGDPLVPRLTAKLAKAFHATSSAISLKERTPVSAPLTKNQTISLPDGVPQPALPADNPLTAERIALGRSLFHEQALSRDGTVTCASCHLSEAGLSDPRRFSIGVDGKIGHRNAMPLFNLAWKSSFFWDGRAPSLREQVMIPIADPLEMDTTPATVVTKLKSLPAYSAAFARAFGSPEISEERFGLALEAYLMSLTSFDSKFDQAQRGVAKLSADEQRGFELFMTERDPRLGAKGADCFHCHGGPLFTDHQFRNNGLALTETDTGRSRTTAAAIDRGAFATPSLRNIAITAPYMHDGRFTTLEQVLDHYSEGVKRSDVLDPNLAKHPDGGLHLSAEDKRCVIAFLRSLTDESFSEKASLQPSRP